MSRPLTIVVGGYIVGYPLGGMTWHHLNYLLGLHDLGHEVWFLEDSGSYSLPYDPSNWTCSPDSSYGREYLRRTFAQYGLPPRWCYYSQFEDMHYGLGREELHALLARADLLICVSGVTPWREDRPRPRRTLVIDTDPVFTQLRMGWDADFTDYYRRFDAVATFGPLIGTSESPLPTHGFDWIPTRQPVCLRHWPATPAASDRLTTVGKWEHEARDVEFAGRSYRSSKGVEWLKLLDLPGRSPWTLNPHLAAMPGEMRRRFEAAGWRIGDAEAVTASCRSFADFIRDSGGELTVAKQIYAGLPSGWFSDRSACYLAAGRPVVTQSSGFEKWLPTGEGLFAFVGVDDAANAIEAIVRDPAAQGRAARALAERHFDSRKVLGELIERAL